MRLPERALGRLIDDFKPVALVSTYPLYPYFLKRIRQGIGGKLPVFTVVTDSIEINAAWLRAPSDWWLVTDPLTREEMIRKNLPAEKIIDTGFPVNPGILETHARRCRGLLRSLPRSSISPPPSARSSRSHGRALLDASPAVRLTIVLGRNVRRLYPQAQETQGRLPRPRPPHRLDAAGAAASQQPPPRRRQGRRSHRARGHRRPLPDAHPPPRARPGGGKPAPAGGHRRRWHSPTRPPPCAAGFPTCSPTTPPAGAP